MVGTRPEAIKLKPVANALARLGQIPRLILTGQHPLIASDFGLEAYPRIALACAGCDNPDDFVEQVSRAIAVTFAERPALLVVQGDTSSAMGGALAAFAAAIPVAHVEAGLRTFDQAMPWPEEAYRTAIDAESELLFAPTEISAANLHAEGVRGRIFVTGNTAIDALREHMDATNVARPKSGVLRVLVTCHRRESWSGGLLAIAEALRTLSVNPALMIDVVLHPNPVVANTMRAALAGMPRIRVLEPMGHAAMIKTMQASDILLSDSGGVQEEAPALGVPLLVLRDKTERPEGVASGNMLLVGTDPGRIVQNVTRLLDGSVRAAMGRRAFPYGDGRSADRIAGHIANFLAQKASDGVDALRA